MNTINIESQNVNVISNINVIGKYSLGASPLFVIDNDKFTVENVVVNVNGVDYTYNIDVVCRRNFDHISRNFINADNFVYCVNTGSISRAIENRLWNANEFVLNKKNIEIYL